MMTPVTCPTGGLASPHTPGLRPSPGQAETAFPPTIEQQLVPAVRLDDLLPGTRNVAEIAGRSIMFVRDDDGSVYAIEAFCTHAAGPLGEGTLTSDRCIVCPWHGATFDARSGQVLRGPARKGLRTYQTSVEDGTVFISM